MDKRIEEMLNHIKLRLTKIDDEYTRLAEKAFAVYLAKRKELHKREIGRYWASDLGNCLYKLYWLYKEGETNDEINGALLSGIIIHEALEDGFKEMGYEVEKEIEIDFGDFKIVGSADVVGDNFVIDIKTSKYDNLNNQNIKEIYLTQLAIYVHALNKEEGILLVTRRNDLKLVAYKYSRSELEEYYQKAVKRARLLHLHLISGIEPQPEPSSLCMFCKIRDRCPLYREANKKSKK